VKQREMVASLAVAPRLLYWTQACVDRNLRARTSSCTRRRNVTNRGRNATRCGRVAMGADGWKWARTTNDMARTAHDGCGRPLIGADGWQWARTTNNMARTAHDGRGRPLIGADGSQWARTSDLALPRTLRARTLSHRARTRALASRCLTGKKLLL
jgi:hypothetical protein